MLKRVVSEKNSWTDDLFQMITLILYGYTDHGILSICCNKNDYKFIRTNKQTKNKTEEKCSLMLSNHVCKTRWKKRLTKKKGTKIQQMYIENSKQLYSCVVFMHYQ